MNNTHNKILIACEESGKVRDAFIKQGFDAVSCDILPSRQEGPHIQGDVTPLLRLPWLAVIAFPPCTFIASTGVMWNKSRPERNVHTDAGAEFFMACVNANAQYIAVENPIGVMSKRFRKPTQIIQPWHFGHGEQKATCLWLKNLPILAPTKIVSGREQRIWKLAPSPDRARQRSETYQGIADAMADQWGYFLKCNI